MRALFASAVTGVLPSRSFDMLPALTKFRPDLPQALMNLGGLIVISAISTITRMEAESRSPRKSRRSPRILWASRFSPSSDRGGPFFRREHHEVGIEEGREFVSERALEQFLHGLRRVIEESVVRVRTRDRDRIGTDLPPSVRADDPVRVKERELRMPRDGVDVPAAQIMPLRADLPVFTAEVEVRVLEADAEGVRDVDRVAPRSVDQKSCAQRFVRLIGPHSNPFSRVHIDAVRRGLESEPDVKVIIESSDRLDVGSQEELCPSAVRVLPQRLREHLVIDGRVRLRPDRAMAANVRLEASHILRAQKGEFVLSHPVREAPVLVFLETGHLVRTDSDFERADGQPGQAAFRRDRLPHPVGGLSATRADLSPDRVQVERSMNDAGVSARRVHRDLRFLLEDGNATVVAVREPVRERGPEDPATDDRDVPGLHGAISRKSPEVIMPVGTVTCVLAA